MATSEWNCRFYEEKYPEVEQNVVCLIKNIADEELGAYVSLLEYNNIEGMIQFSEVSRRRIRSISKLLRVNKIEILVVLRVDKEKGYIDLSKKRVSKEDTAKCEHRYQLSKIVHSIMGYVTKKTNIPIEELYEKVTWPLYKKFPHAYDAFMQSLTNPDSVFNEENGCRLSELPPGVLDTLLSDIRLRLTPQPIKVRADVEVTCFKYEGIDAVKAALSAGLSVSPDIRINLEAPPIYNVVTISLDKKAGTDQINEAIVKIKEVIESKGGSCSVKNAPYCIGDENKKKDLIEQDDEDEDEDEDEVGL